ncbi:MAG TPA: Flp pilus assembly protein CpaB [Isosphaeraceae bacterium]|jgi:pilus assembly protein CpaB|nr:Flp pilus assembly protein CpaB [Isosphaeraceae bacterium]
MNGKSVIVLVLAVVCGLGAMYGTSQLLSRDRGKQVETQEIVIAVRDLKAEEVIKESMVELTKMPRDSVPAGSFTSIKDVIDRSLQIPILKDEPIVDPKLSPKGTPAGLVSRIPTGMRAFAVEINEQTGVSGFIMPGHRVDIVQTKVGSNGVPINDSELVLQNVLVLASGQTLTRPEDKSIMSHTVTLAITPRQVEALVTARTKGPLTLSLRGVNDNDLSATPPPPPPTPEPPVAAQPIIPPPVQPPAPLEPVRRKYLVVVHGMQGVEYVRLNGDNEPTAPEPDPALNNSP